LHDFAFTWGGVSHDLLHQKCFITRLQAAGSVPREQPALGHPVSAHPANPSSSRLPSCCGDKQPLAATKQSARKSNEAPGLEPGSIKPSPMAEKYIARVMGRCVCLLPSPKTSSELPAARPREV